MAPAPTHWMADCLKNDEWIDNPGETPELAAEQLMEVGRGNNDCWEAWDSLERYGEAEILVRGFLATTEAIEDPDQQFDGYEPGCEWFRRTDKTRRVVVSLKYEAKP